MIRIKGGRVIDPANGTDKVTDLYIQGSKIVAPPKSKSAKVTTIEAKGKWVVPGLIDMHVHFREPGQEYKETIQSGCEAAAAGGYTSVATMPNTNPVCDNASVVEYIRHQASQANGVNVYPMGAISKGLQGEELAEIADMVKSGAVAITDDGHCLMNSAVMRSALEYASNLNLLVCQHCEDHDLSAGGSMHEGEMSTRLGLAGIPSAAESIMAGRDIQLLQFTQSRYHIQHVSTKEAVDLVRQGKKRGLAVSCEVAPHHWSLDDTHLTSYDTNYKMNPPLRSEEHVKAVRRGLKDGTIDCIATDHAPHVETDKLVEFDQALNGITGLETALPLALNLVREEVLSPSDLIAKLTINPARLLGLEKGTLSVDADADITIIDPDAEWVYSRDIIRSKSRNTPWLDATLTGRAITTIAAGKIIHQL